MRDEPLEPWGGFLFQTRGRYPMMNIYDMPEPLEKTYNPKDVEDRIYRLWEESGYFNPDKLPRTHRKPFTIIMPPPNANGALHAGHALFVTLEDLMTRFERMRGRRALWLPGADHAGFETQVVFDKRLEKEGRNRFGLSRETLFKEIWKFTQANKAVMERQLRKLGASADWSREKFTLDPDIIETVGETFRALHADGLVYRALRVVNWCPKHQTALSDLEVKYVERTDPLYYITYGPLTLATVRPETKFGDTALAVNPKDKRYRAYIGREIQATGLLGSLTFRVIADEAVDPKFGTGVVKVTPAHDATDFEIWQRHKDEIPGPKQIIDERGRLTKETGPYAGLKVAEARARIAEDMAKAGILLRTEPNYTHQIATCYKCGNTLEPLLKPQWFVNMTEPPKRGGLSLRDAAVKAVTTKQVKFVTKKFEKTFFHWMRNIRDWNISRQIAWGIRIPAWYCADCGAAEVEPRIAGRWFIVRHGETDWNAEGRTLGHAQTPLNARGVTQARAVAESLKDKGIDLVVTSDLPRARQTAEIIAEATHAELLVDPGLRERNMGITEGMLREERNALYGEDLYGYETKPPGGESFKELEARAWRAFNAHVKRHRDRTVLMVTHGGPIKAILKNLKHLSFESSFLGPEPNHAEPLELTLTHSRCPRCGSDVFEQDPDVFDTWFSSAQWPFAALGYPRSRDFKTFYPTDIMATGYDILFFWVARMLMLGLYRTGKAPFRYIYLHGLVRDRDKQKMSKSKGNVIDPLGIAETYGVDAVRMALIAGTSAGNDPVFSEDKIRGYRNFATKLWNMGRFILFHAEHSATTSPKPKLTKRDRAHLTAFQSVKRQVTKALETFRFHEAAFLVYHYIWHTFADKIIEEAKPRLESTDPLERSAASALLQELFRGSLALLHPFMPYVTEALYQKLERSPRTPLLIKKW